MPQLISCPRCGANPAYVPAPGATVQCQYCTAVYQVPLQQTPAAPPVPVTSPRSMSPALVVAIVGGIGALVLAVMGVALFAYLAASREQAREPGESPPIISPVAGGEEETPHAGGPTPEEPEAPSTATFEFHSLKSSVKSSFYVLGFVTNTSPHTIDKPKVTVVLLDAQGKEVGSDDGYAERDHLPPNTRSPIKVLVSDPPAHQKLRYEVVASKASYIPEEVAGLEITEHQEKKGTYGSSWESVGKVKNGGKQPAKFVKIEILAYRGDKLVGVDGTYADGDVLRPGATARFRAYLLIDPDPDRFELTVRGRKAD